MAKEYRIVPKAKTLAELRGIEEISLFFPEPRGLAETEIDQIIVDCQTARGHFTFKERTMFGMKSYKRV